MATPYLGYENIIMLLEPKDIATTITASAYMSLKGANRAAILVIFGAITSATADTYDITLEAATAEGGTEAAIDFYYRKAGALGANTWGAITSCSATGGLSISADEDNIMIWIELNVDEMAASDYTVARVRLTDNADMAAGLVSVLGFVDPVYRQTTHKSVTASASS